MKKYLLPAAAMTVFVAGMAVVPSVFAASPDSISSWTELTTCLTGSDPVCKIQAGGLDASNEVTTITVSRAVILDLNGATLKAPTGQTGLQVAAGADLTIQNGTLDGGNATSPKATITITGGTADQTSKLTIAKNANLLGGCGVKINNTSNNEGIVLDIQGDITANQPNAGKGAFPLYIDGNLQQATTLPQVTISGNLTNNQGGVAFYQGGVANTTVTGTLTGATGASIKAGTVTFNNATVIGNGPATEPEVSGNGTNPTGAAIQVSSVGNYASQPPIEVHINGGTYISENANTIEVFGDEKAVADSHIKEITLAGDVKLEAPKGEVYSNSLSSFTGITTPEGETINFGDTTVWPVPAPETSAEEVANPNTADAIALYATIAVVALLGLGATAFLAKKANR